MKIRMSPAVTTTNKTWLELGNFIIYNYAKTHNKIEDEVVTQSFIFSTDNIKSIITGWINSRITYDPHDFDVSTNFKNIGNLAYASNKYENFYKAAYYYTKALFRAPREGNLSAICHSNRAAALIVMGFFEEAFDDCVCALECGYQNLVKIYYRQATCAIGMNNALKLKECISNLEFQVTKNNKVLQNDLERFKNELKKLEESCEDNNNNINDLKEPYIEIKKQKVMSSREKGRYVIADDIITKNDEIMSEKAFSFVTTYASVPASINIFESNCMNCGKEHIIPFPCYGCLHVFYCSIECRQKQSLIHSFECKAMLKNIFDEIGIGYLAFETLLIGFSDLKKYCNNKTLDQNLTVNQIWDLVTSYRSKNTANYSNVLNLITNFEKNTISIDDYLRLSLTGTMLTIYLSEHTNFFCYDLELKAADATTSRNWEIVVAGLITKHIGQIISNAHTINKLNLTLNDCDESSFNSIWKEKNHLKLGNLHYFKEIKPVFAAIYPRISLYNHSCEPNFQNRFNKVNLTVIANKSLKIGDEILNSYGIDCRNTPKDIRLKHLVEQYNFVCDCENCKNDDHKYKKNRLLKCCKASCSHEFYPMEIAKMCEIWNDEIVYDNSLHIKCPKCRTRWKFDWYKLFKNEIGNVKYNQSLTYEKLKVIYDLYQSGNKFVNQFHVLKLQMTWEIMQTLIYMLKDGVKIKTNFLEFLMPISADMMKYAENYYGLYDLQYIVRAIFYLDWISQLKYNSFNFEIDYDLQKIKKSFDILPDRTKLIFNNYFDDYVMGVNFI